MSKRILLVEDDRSFSNLMTQVLESRGHKVHPVSSADAALSAMVAEAFDVVLTDFDLGNLSEDGRKVIEDADALMPSHCRTILWSGILRDEELEYAAVQPNYNLVKDSPMAVITIIEGEE